MADDHPLPTPRPRRTLVVAAFLALILLVVAGVVASRRQAAQTDDPAVKTDAQTAPQVTEDCEEPPPTSFALAECDADAPTEEPVKTAPASARP